MQRSHLREPTGRRGAVAEGQWDATSQSRQPSCGPSPRVCDKWFHRPVGKKEEGTKVLEGQGRKWRWHMHTGNELENKQNVALAQVWRRKLNLEIKQINATKPPKGAHWKERSGGRRAMGCNKPRPTTELRSKPPGVRQMVPPTGGQEGGGY